MRGRRRRVFSSICWHVLSGIEKVEIFEGDPMLETVETTGLCLLNHSRRACLYPSNHVRKDPSEEDKQEAMDAGNVLEEMEALRETRLLPCWSSCQERPERSDSGCPSLTNDQQALLRLAKPPCLTGIPANLPQLLLKRADLKYSVSSLPPFCHRSSL